MEKSDEADDGACGDEKDDNIGFSSLAHSASFGSSPSSSLDFRRIAKAPNKKKYEDDMEELNKQIHIKEAELKGAGTRSRESVTADLRGIRGEREAAIGKRKKIDTDLRLLNQEITKKMGLLSRTESNLHYKNEAKIDDAIRNLELQLKTQNFRLSEERRIVAEVDKLKRSKKVLTEYFTQKKEVDQIRESQRRMRGEKEFYYKTVTNLNRREDELRKNSQEKRIQTEEIKKDLDQLYENKRALTASFKQSEADYHRTMNEKRHKHRQESFKRREEDRKAKEQAWRKHLIEFEAHAQPFEDEKNLCNTLISYLQRYITTERDDATLPSPREEQPENAIGSAPGPADSLDDGMFVRLKKSEDAEVDYTITSKRPNRRSSRKGRKLSVMKPLAHTPQIIAQFSSLNLNAPSNMSEVTASVEQIQARKRYYEDHVGIPRPVLCNLSGSFSSSDSYSSLESPLRERSTTWGFVEVQPAIAENQTPSDAGTSAESGFHDMSRQASKTESSESTAECSDRVLEEMIQQSAEHDESEHSRSSSDTITLEDHIAELKDENRASDCRSHDDNIEQSSDTQNKTSQGIINKNNDSHSDTHDQSHDSESIDLPVFEEAGTKSSFTGEELLRESNHEDKNKPLSDYELGMRKKIANYDTDFPPALTRVSNDSSEDSGNNLRHCDDKRLNCDDKRHSENKNIEMAVNVKNKRFVESTECENSKLNVESDKNASASSTESECGYGGLSIRESNCIDRSDESGWHGDVNLCDSKNGDFDSVGQTGKYAHEEDAVTHI